MKRFLTSLTLSCLVMMVGVASANATPAAWQLEQPAPLSPPAGVTGVDRPVGLGQVGDVKFWAPNRGLLITAGNPPVVPAGLWAYNGVSWHLLSTVCGSGSGRIAWAGPDEFWTISDPAPNSQEARQIGTTLCHFQNGAVVASYASPLTASDPYVQMTAAACNGPDDCWFGGGQAAAPLTGGFHLHWDGSTLTDVLAPQDRQIYGLASLHGQFFESALVTAGDQPQPAEALPQLLHRLIPGAPIDQEFTAEPFSPSSFPTTPSFLTLGTDGTELWAVGGSTQDGQRPALAARFVNGSFQELGIDPDLFAAPNAFLGVAPEPGAGDAWVTVGAQGVRQGVPYPAAKVARINSDGTVGEVDTVPAPTTGATNHGSAAGPIACPAVNDCWMVTQQGWLFHLTDGTAHTVDSDSNFAGVIDLRPPDAGIASFPSDSSPLDDSLANQPIVIIPPTVVKPKPQKPKPVVTQLHSRLKGTTLRLSFTLHFRARISLSGLRRGRQVATTGAHVYAPGKHVLLLHLNRRRWPSRLRFSVALIKGQG